MKAKKIGFDNTSIWVETTEEKIGSLSLKAFKKLANATKEQLLKFELWNDNQWIHWEEIGEDLSVEGFFSFHN
jgi:Protein of unknown function (DUF2442)